MKKIIFLIIAMVFVIGLALPGCEGGGLPEITIAICGPMDYIQGSHMWNGATLARDEINTAGGVMVGATAYNIKLLKVDTDEIATPASAAVAMENAITVQKAQFVIGGFRTEGVTGMVQVAGNTTTPFWICGAATYSLLNSMPLLYGSACKGTPYYPYPGSYPQSGGYKYIFRATPYNDVFLVNNAFLMATMVAKRIETIIGANATNKVKFAIFAESLTWADAMVESARGIISLVAPYVFGWNWQLVPVVGTNGTGVWRVTDTQDATTVGNYLNAIKSAGAHVIFTILSGPVGVTFGKVKGQLGVPAVVVGINVEAQDVGYWNKTNYATGLYGADNEITMGTWATGVNQTNLTSAFLTKYSTAGWSWPVYTASSYDVVWTIKKALEAVDVIEEYNGGDPDQDAVIAWFEDPANAQLISTGTSAYFQLWDGSTSGAWKGYTWPALNSSQINHWYGTTGINSEGPNVCNFTMPPYSTHDLVYGPSWVTGLGVQWQGGVQKGVWPNSATWQYQNAMSRYVAGINWTSVQYPGITTFNIPDSYCQAWTGSPCP